ncbi:hypothetical protein EG028_09495 [Chitinophaga barathri]|uniref:Uncharacterized protein n=1 Tax=Chitinophaga barathri TaxID=1647451 RepID=A0A3N4MCG0_9BACT|nr:hypothetical protein EG028_09495 [Chitinophaga barathri]
MVTRYENDEKMQHFDVNNYVKIKYFRILALSSGLLGKPGNFIIYIKRPFLLPGSTIIYACLLMVEN